MTPDSERLPNDKIWSELNISLSLSLSLSLSEVADTFLVFLQQPLCKLKCVGGDIIICLQCLLRSVHRGFTNC